MPDAITASAYLTVKADRLTYGRPDPETGLREVTAARIIAVRQGRPARVERDEVVVKVAIQLPARVFDPITPSALIVVPEDLILARHVLEAEAVDDAAAPEAP